MNISRNVLLVFPQEIMYKPLIYRLAREFDLQFNILEAKIYPRREGRLILELRGAQEALDRGLAYLVEEGVGLTSIAEESRRDEERCVHCGACTAVCRTGALVVDPTSMEVLFDAGACVACGQCEAACPMQALSGINIERLGRIAADL